MKNICEKKVATKKPKGEINVSELIDKYMPYALIVGHILLWIVLVIDVEVRGGFAVLTAKQIAALVIALPCSVGVVLINVLQIKEEWYKL